MKSFATDKGPVELQARRTRQEQLRDYLSQQVEAKKAQEDCKKATNMAWGQRFKAEAEEWAALEARRKEETAERAAAYRSDLGKQAEMERTKKLEAKEYKRLGPMGAVKGASGEDLPYSLMEHVGMNTLGVTVRCVETNTSDRFWGYINTNEMRGILWFLNPGQPLTDQGATLYSASTKKHH